MNRLFGKCILLISFVLLATMAQVSAQTLDEILLHFSEQEMNVPISIRQKMLENKGNTLLNYDDFKLNIYDKRNRFLRITTPTGVVYEIATWKIRDKKELLVALCQTHCGMSCQSDISFYLPAQNWLQQPSELYLPELTLDDIFDSKKLEKNYFTPQNIIKDFKVITQFLLPQTGHDIIVIFTCLDELDKDEYQRIHKYLSGVMLDLIWEKETFVKSESYFSGN